MNYQSYKDYAKWDRRFLELAKHISEWSKDPSTKVGAVAIKDRRILATGYNGFPRGVRDQQERLLNREQKLLRTVHAEANIIAQAAQHGTNLTNATIYIWPFLPCNACCSLLIQAGITRVVVPHKEIPERWRESFLTSTEMLREAQVQLYKLNLD